VTVNIFGFYWLLCNELLVLYLEPTSGRPPALSEMHNLPENTGSLVWYLKRHEVFSVTDFIRLLVYLVGMVLG
jgi:hypothetical protein